MKSQSLIVQFILFFLIGLTIFLAISQLFKFHSDIIKRDITSSSLKLSNSFISSAVITAVDSCKGCDVVKISTRIGKTAGYYTIAELDDGLITSVASGESFSSSIHNLKETIDNLQGKVSSLKPLTLTFDRTNNKLTMVQ